jgi:hypothetical protein
VIQYICLYSVVKKRKAKHANSHSLLLSFIVDFAHKMHSSQKLLIYNQFNKGVLRIIRERSTVAATVCPYAHAEENEINVEQVKHEVAKAATTATATASTNYLPYSQVPGPKPLPIIGNTWRSVCYYVRRCRLSNRDSC